MLDAWLNATIAVDPLKRTMVPPVVMASVTVTGLESDDLIFKNGFE